MATTSGRTENWWRYPPAVGGVQVNHCKNPRCANFGIPSKQTHQKRPSNWRESPVDYSVVAGGKDYPLLRCNECKEHLPMQSNIAIVEEVLRIAKYLEPTDRPSCKNGDCIQNGVPLNGLGAKYKRSGTTLGGSIRYQCLCCKKTFTEKIHASARQRMTHKNKDVFLLLVNKSPLKRIAAVTQLPIDTVFRKIKFIHTQCLLFAGEREHALLNATLSTRYIAVDRQIFVVNWKSRKDRRNVNLLAVASADMETGFVFGMHLNYDAEIDAEFVHSDMNRYGDEKRTRPFRRYARLWLPQDYSKPVGKVNKAQDTFELNSDLGIDKIGEKIEGAYAAAILREDIESGDVNAFVKAPPNGMQVHEQSTLSAHMHFIGRLLAGAEKLRFFLDQESGIRAAFMGAFIDRVKARTADAWYVSVLKDVTIDGKRKAVKHVRDLFKAAQEKFPDMSEKQIELLLMKREMARAKAYGKWNDKWLAHPMPTMSEPAKKICWLTDMNDYDDDHAARLYLKASLHPVDRFFMQVRRRLSLAERPIGSAANNGRVWNGYGAYQPANLVSALEIFRVYYNYCQPGKDKKTPAMKLGLAKGVISPEDIIYFMPSRDGRHSRSLID